MKENYLLPSQTAQALYAGIKDLPIVDYHCHLSPKEIYEDRKFDNIGEIWLGHDHYKWRLMREYGIEEARVTGDASWHDKFLAYADAIATAAGNPLYHWTQLELARYFDITEPLNPDTAEEIWQRANQKIRESGMSPRKLITDSNVLALATTDDPIDTLEYHKLLQADDTFATRVVPTFRTDRLTNVQKDDFVPYLALLSQAADIKITDLASLKAATIRRLDYFCSLGCTISDVGMFLFPNRVADEQEAADSLALRLAGKALTEAQTHGLIGYLHLFLAAEYKKRGIAMQWHLASVRNVNTDIYRALGPDCGVDCMSSTIPVEDVLALLDAVAQQSGLPKTILYTLNPAQNAAFSVIAGCFPGVIMGTAWWFCDHKRGIEDVIRTVAETAHLGTFLGMLTDSRSFLSYARHEYFRRILCAVIAEWVDNGEFPCDAYTQKLLENICLNNARALF
ncbi:MAG: glucuronate isomerase [Clostridia bacterium]|nr:glucuronate isomerase [Clostridia bacterium]